MADVSGTIGNEYVELNNAATEATLRLLLQATLATTKGQKDAIKDMVAKAGLDPAAVAAANTGLKGLGTGASSGAVVLGRIGAAGANVADGFLKVGSSLTPLIGKLVDGTAGLSDMMSPLSRLPGILGLFGTALTKAVEYQEANLKTYQQITQSGASLGGSLTDLRQAALNSYMTLDKFSELVQTNSEVLSRMGGTVNDGAKAFIGLSKTLISGDIGTSLMSLGYTTDQVNQGMLSYIEATGGRNKKELQNTEGIIKGTQNYLTQLDELAQITGTTREQQAAAAKEAAANQSYQAYLMTLTEEEKLKAERARADALARGGKGAEQAMMSAALGLPPMTKAAQQYTAIAGNMNQVTMKQVAAIKDSNKTIEDQKRIGTEYNQAAVRDTEQLGSARDAIIMGGGEMAGTVSAMTAARNRAIQQDAATDAKALEQQAQIQAEREKREKSQATEMAKAEKAMKEIGQVINDLLAPAITFLTKVAATLAEALAGGIKLFSGLNDGVKLAAAGFALLVAMLVKDAALRKAKEIAQSTKDKVQTLGSSPTNALYVKIVGSVPGVTGTDTSGGKTGGKFGKLGGLGLGMAGGLAGSMASEALGADTTAGKTADMLGMAATGAGMGAMLGPLGALAGGLIGGGYGAYKNFFDGPKMANGGIVTKPTVGMVGENEPEIVSPLRHIESLRTELETLNKQSAEMLKFMRDTAENTRRTTDATVALGGDLFKF